MDKVILVGILIILGFLMLLIFALCKMASKYSYDEFDNFDEVGRHYITKEGDDKDV